MGLDSLIVSSSAVITQEVLGVAGDFADGVIYSLEFSLKEESVLDKSLYSLEDYRNNSLVFFEKFEERYDGVKANLFAAMGYDTVMLTYKALEECGENSECIRDYLLSVRDYNGASGMFSFDEYGDVSKEMHLMIIRDGEFVNYD